MLALGREDVNATLAAEDDDRALVDVPENALVAGLAGVGIGARSRALAVLGALEAVLRAPPHLPRAALQLARQIVDQRQHELLLVGFAVLDATLEPQRLGVELALEPAQDLHDRRVGEVHRIDGADGVQAQPHATLERRAAQQLEAQRALAGLAEHPEQAGVDLAENLEDRRVAAELGQLLRAQHPPHRHLREHDVLTGEQAVDALVLAIDRGRDEIDELRLAGRTVALEHLTRLGRAAALGVRAAIEVREHRARAQRLLVFADLANAAEDLVDRDARRLLHVLAAVERHAQGEVEVARHRQRVDTFDL